MYFSKTLAFLYCFGIATKIRVRTSSWNTTPLTRMSLLGVWSTYVKNLYFENSRIEWLQRECIEELEAVLFFFPFESNVYTFIFLYHPMEISGVLFLLSSTNAEKVWKLICLLIRWTVFSNCTDKDLIFAWSTDAIRVRTI